MVIKSGMKLVAQETQDSALTGRIVQMGVLPHSTNSNRQASGLAVGKLLQGSVKELIEFAAASPLACSHVSKTNEVQS